MRNLILLLLLSTCSLSHSQTIIRESSVRQTQVDTVRTSFIYEDKKGNTYPVILNTRTGKCYVIKYYSFSPHKPYRYKLSSKVSATVARYYNITYRPK